MRTFNIDEAKTQISRLVERAAKGETLIIAKAGKPIAKLAPLMASDVARPSRRGFLAGQTAVPADFDTMGESEIERTFGDS
jgi:prevent-host-death family protein